MGVGIRFASHAIPEVLFYKNLINLMAVPVSRALYSPFLKPHIHHHHIVLLAEVDEHLASLISSTQNGSTTFL
jgi:hypothetical protein